MLYTRAFVGLLLLVLVLAVVAVVLCGVFGRENSGGRAGLGRVPMAKELQQIESEVLRQMRAQEEAFNIEVAEHVVADIKAGRLPVAKDGRAVLPDGAAGLSVDGAVYVTRASDGAQGCLFPSWLGKGSNLRGYLYLAKPSRAMLWRDSSTGALVFSGILPVTGAPPKVGEAQVEQKLGRGWHLVSRTLD